MTPSIRTLLTCTITRIEAWNMEEHVVCELLTTSEVKANPEIATSTETFVTLWLYAIDFWHWQSWRIGVARLCKNLYYNGFQGFCKWSIKWWMKGHACQKEALTMLHSATYWNWNELMFHKFKMSHGSGMYDHVCMNRSNPRVGELLSR